MAGGIHEQGCFGDVVALALPKLPNYRRLLTGVPQGQKAQTDGLCESASGVPIDRSFINPCCRFLCTWRQWGVLEQRDSGKRGGQE